MMPTLSFRWMVTEPKSPVPGLFPPIAANKDRVLQQLFVPVNARQLIDHPGEWGGEDGEWRDVPEVVEGG